MSNESTLSCEKLYDEANELLLNDDYEDAIKIYTSSIEKCGNENPTVLYNSYIGRSQAYIKLKDFNKALADAELALKLNADDTRAFLKRGTCFYNLKQFENALNAFEEGKQKLGTELDAKKNIFNDWISKCKKEIPEAKVVEAKVEKSVESKPHESEQIEAVKPLAPPQIKHEWYQTESLITISILVKNVTASDVTIKPTDNTLKIESNDQEKLKLNFDFNLANQIIPDQTQIKYLTNKIEIKLKKSEANQWKKLEADPNEAKLKISTIKPDYPSSSKNPKNWDKLAADVSKEEEDEKLEGDAALNKLFKQIYANGSDETRRAMNKSFAESGGTVLSTNWKDIGAKKIEVNAPDGMEFKKWD